MDYLNPIITFLFYPKSPHPNRCDRGGGTSATSPTSPRGWAIPPTPAPATPGPSASCLLAGLTLDIPLFWPKVKVPQFIRKVLSLEKCDSGSAVLERFSREHGCVSRITMIPRT